ncbi:MAG: hypothetical protein U9N14_04410 [Pseudomonadota bacterium]|nr:hypothetical protein [Pseudomonadota bacterium]
MPPPPGGPRILGSPTPGGYQSPGTVRLVDLPLSLSDLTKARTVHVQIMDRAPDGVVTASSPLGKILLRATRALAPGESLTLQIPPGRPPTRAQILSSPQPMRTHNSPPSQVTSESWPALARAMDWLTHNNPETVEMLRTALSAEFDSHANSKSETNAKGWQSLVVPFHNGESPDRMRLFWRVPEDADVKADKDRPVRFLVEVEPQRLGPVQLDGLARTGRLDMILRTQEPLATCDRQTIRTAFTEALNAGGQSGEITFQTGRDRWIDTGRTQAMMERTV